MFMSSPAILIPRPLHSYSHHSVFPSRSQELRVQMNTHTASSASIHTHADTQQVRSRHPIDLHPGQTGDGVDSDESDDAEGSDDFSTGQTRADECLQDIRYDPHSSAGLDEDSFFMNLAIEQARRCEPSLNAYSVGAVLVSTSRHLVLSTGYSRELEGNTHAEECALIKYQKMWEEWSKRKREGRDWSAHVKRSQDEQDEQAAAFSLSSSASSAASTFSDTTRAASTLSASASCASLSSSPASSCSCSSPAPVALPSSSSSTSNSSRTSQSSSVLDSLSDVLSLASPFPVPDDFVMYTTMEPCSKRLSGKRACSYRLVDAAIRRVVVGALEPAFFVRCEGIHFLRSQHVQVSVMEPPMVWQKRCLEPNEHIYQHNAKEAEKKTSEKEER